LICRNVAPLVETTVGNIEAFAAGHPQNVVAVARTSDQERQ
jgi:hypothetical protein